jgi:hypothetical protein
MKIIFLGILALAVAKPKEALPSFTLVEERSANASPLVKITFADGSSDNLVLNKYENLEGHFIGHLENEPNACVAMVNHPEHAELTIMSSRVVGSTMYKWHYNGNVELVPEVFSNGLERDEVMDRDGENDEPIANQSEEDALENIEDNMTADEASTVPTTAKLQIRVAYDDSILTKLGSADAVVSYWNAAAPHLQARYCHSSLGTKIKVERIGDFKHHAGKTITASGASLQAMFDDTVADLGDADLIAYMCHDTSSLYGTIGIAYRPVICDHSSANKYKESINEWRPTSVAFGGLLAHEIGHNLGFYHDFDDHHGGQSSACNQNNHIMSYGSSKDKWSTCSKADFEARYLWVQQTSYVSWCMEAEIGDACGASPSPPSPTPAPPSPTPAPPSTTASTCPGSCGTPNWKGDNWCDDENNNCGCEWDGGDCCGDDVKTQYCSECKCLDPNAGGSDCKDKWSEAKCQKRKKWCAKGKKVRKNCKKTCELC